MLTCKGKDWSKHFPNMIEIIKHTSREYQLCYDLSNGGVETREGSVYNMDEYVTTTTIE
jgi:transposase